MLAALFFAAALAEEVIPPQVVSCPEVAWPGGEEGPQTVTLWIVVDDQGRVESTSLDTGKSPYADLVRAAAAECTFTPATADGVAIPVEIPFSWTLSPPTPQASVDEAVARYRVAGPASVVRTLSSNQIRMIPGTLGDPVRALTNQPGPVRTPFDAGYLLLRGGGQNDTALFLDGVRVPLLFHLGGQASILHPELVEEVQLFPGAFDPRYGNSLSGAVDLHSRRPTGPFKMKVNTNLAWADAMVSVPLGPGHLAGAVRRSYLDGVLGLALGTESAKIASRFSDGQLRYDTEHFGVMWIGVSDAVNAPTEIPGELVTIRQDATQLQLRANADVGAGELRAQAWAAIQRRRFTKDSTTIPADPSTGAEAFQTEPIDEEERQITPGFRVEWAGPVGVFDTEWGTEGELRRYDLRREELGRGTWLGSVAPYAWFGTGQKLRVEGGARLETLVVPDQLFRMALSPRGTVRWAPIRSLSVIAEGGRLHQSAEPLFLAGFPEGEYRSFEQSDFASLGVAWSDPRWAVDITGWGRWIRHLTALEVDGTIGDMEGRAYGIEAMGQLHLAQTEARAIVQYSRSLRREEPEDPFEPTRHDQPLIVQALVLQELPHKWSIAGRWRFGSGFLLTTNVTEAYDLLTQDTRPLTVDADGRLPPFHALDLKVAKHWDVRRWTIDLSLDIQNVYFRRVPEPVVGSVDDSVPVYGYGLPILPILGVVVGWENSRAR